MPMLMKGNCWKKRRDAVDRKGNPIVQYPVYVEDKHDEVRCHIIVDNSGCVQYLSYAGNPLANMQQFDEMFKTLARGTGYWEFDMGFECNGNFNDSYRWVRSTSGIPEDLAAAAHRFFVFGLPHYAGHDSLAMQRIRRADIVLYAKDWVSVPVDTPFMVQAEDALAVEAAFINARARGLEGVMVKQPRSSYERKRTDGWLKMKPEDDADGVITGINEAISEDGVALGRAGSVDVRMPDGSEASPHGIGFELGRDMWQNPGKYIGQWCEFKFMERDRQGGYRHPTFYRIREGK